MSRGGGGGSPPPLGDTSAGGRISTLDAGVLRPRESKCNIISSTVSEEGQCPHTISLFRLQFHV